VAAAVAADPVIGLDAVVIPVVGECDDTWLNDARVVQVEAADAGRAVESAGGDFAQGAVGAGTGMVCFGFKGGIGSASRVAGDAVVGALVLANFGERPELRVDGVPVGRLLGEGPAPGSHAPAPPDPRPPAGSCIVVLATDAPLDSATLTRLARRAGLGLARTGSVAHHGSGEIFLAFTTAPRGSGPPPAPDPLFSAAVDATEEAVINALWHARTTEGRHGQVYEALPQDEVLRLLRAHGRLRG
jgi:D-aminopeptidase